MTELIPNLHIGNWHEARGTHGFYVVTVACDSPFVGHRHFALVDGPGNSEITFRAAVDAVIEAYSCEKKNVLVHCISGRSRSAAVIVAAAVKLTNRSFCEIYDELLRKHDGTRIHPHLAVLLLNFLGVTELVK